MKNFDDAHYTVSRKFNNCVTNDPCAICGQRCDPTGIDFFLDDTWALVCDDCAAKYAPEREVEHEQNPDSRT